MPQRTYAYLQVRPFLILVHSKECCSSWDSHLPFLEQPYLLIDLISGFLDDADDPMHHLYLPSHLVQWWRLCYSNYCFVHHIDLKYLFCIWLKYCYVARRCLLDDLEGFHQRLSAKISYFEMVFRCSCCFLLFHHPIVSYAFDFVQLNFMCSSMTNSIQHYLFVLQI